MAKFEVIERNGYTWYFYSSPLNTLESEDINNISSNIQVIKEMLIAKGMVANDLQTVQANKNTPFVEVFDILQNIEYNLTAINQNSVKSAYYVDEVEIGEYASNKDDIWRWVQVLNDLFDILTLEKGAWGYLVTTDGFPILEEKRILVRGDLIG
jgi:hypothetical protein